MEGKADFHAELGRLRVPRALVEYLEEARDCIEWVLEGLPEQSDFLLDTPHQPMTPPPRPPGVTPAGYMAASLLYDVHSQICAWRLLTLWRVRALQQTTERAITHTSHAPAQVLIRAVVETAAAYVADGADLVAAWNLTRRRSVRDEATARAFRDAARPILQQVLFGTRRPDLKDLPGSVQRTSVMTLIDKAAKRTEFRGLRVGYERLCDTAHPSAGAMMAMTAGAGRQGTREVPGPVYIELVEGGIFDPQPSHFVALWAWALNAIAIADDRVKQVSDGLGLEAELHRFFALKHWGIVRLQSSRDDCPCGSEQPRKSCRHGVDLGFIVPTVPSWEGTVGAAQEA